MCDPRYNAEDIKGLSRLQECDWDHVTGRMRLSVLVGREDGEVCTRFFKRVSSGNKNAVSVKKYPVFISLRRVVGCKYFLLNDLAADISLERTYGISLGVGRAFR